MRNINKQEFFESYRECRRRRRDILLHSSSKYVQETNRRINSLNRLTVIEIARAHRWNDISRCVYSTRCFIDNPPRVPRSRRATRWSPSRPPSFSLLVHTWWMCRGASRHSTTRYGTGQNGTGRDWTHTHTCTYTYIYTCTHAYAAFREHNPGSSA